MAANSSSPFTSLTRPNAHDLHQAVLSDNVNDVAAILDLDTVDVNRTVCGTTALSLCLYKHNLPLLRLLLLHPKLQSKLDVNKMSKDEKARLEPPLVTACRLGHRTAVHLLVEAGASLEAVDNFRHTALWMATRQRYTDIVHYLIEHGANVNPSSLWTHSPLFFAVKYSSRRTDIAKLLIKHGASVVVEKGPSLLYCSIVQGVVPIAKLVVAAGDQASWDDKLRHELTDGTLTRSKPLIGWLMQELQQPISLQRQCRMAVRKCVAGVCSGRHFLPTLLSLYNLPLPKSVLAYLTLEDEIQLSETVAIKMVSES